MRPKIIAAVLVSVLLVSGLYAQHKIPAGTKGNVIEMNIVNPIGSGSSSFVISTANLPEWLEFSNSTFKIENLKPGQSAIARFVFDLSSSAPLEEEYSILFQIMDENGKPLHKSIDILVAAPAKFELSQNYPNPFNPTTIIKYQLPIDGKVTLKVFDILGREVMTLLDEDKKAGVYEIKFDGSNLASGLYFYRMQSGNFGAVKNMMLLR